MLNNLLRAFLVVAAAAFLSATAVLAAGAPDPGMSSVEDLLLTCPAGDIGFQVIVRDDTGAPCPGVLVSIDFCDCTEAMLCKFAGGAPCLNGKNDLLVLTTDASGMAVFQPAAGGICGGAIVDIVAGGVLLAQRIVLAMDVDGNFAVEMADFTYDPVWNDYNGDGRSDFIDLSIFSLHGNGQHVCDAPISDQVQSWGSIKSLWR